MRERSQAYLRNDPRALELQNSLLSVVVGLIFAGNALFGGNLYVRDPDTYRFMQYVPELGWSVIYTSAGVVHFLTVQLGYHRCRKAILLWKVFLWSVIGLSAVRGDPFAFSGWVFLVLAGSAAQAHVRLKLLKDGTVTDVFSSDGGA
jgi:hypothetical protein